MNTVEKMPQVANSSRPRPARPVLPPSVAARRRAGALAVAAAMAAGGLAAAARPASAELPAPTGEPAVAQLPAQARHEVRLPSPTRANLATAADLAPIARPGQAVGAGVDRPAGRWRARFSMCQQGKDLGERTVLVRDFGQIQTTQLLLGFDSAARAARARTEVLRWFEECETENPRTVTSGEVLETLMVLPPDRLAAGVDPINAVALQASRYNKRTGQGRFEDVTVSITGNRLSILVARSGGQDNNCATQPDDPEIGQCGAYTAAGAVVNRQLRR